MRRRTMMRIGVAAILATVVAANTWASSGSARIAAQQPPAGQPPQGQPPEGRGRGQGGAGRGPAPIPFDDRAGFEAIFDGTSMKNWDGDPAYWRVEGGALVGESTEANPVKQNTFLIYRGGEPADFELKVEFRINNTNSGIQYRSVQVPADDKTGKWVLKGYQADIDIANQFTGMLYEERGRGFLAPRGTAGYVSETQRGTIGLLENGDALKAYIKDKDWNQFHVIARSNTLIHILNGHVTAVFIDDDVKNRTLKGLLGFQIHTGPPMKIEFRNIYLKKV
jgi:3-keto-disaccharide hydrolase